MQAKSKQLKTRGVAIEDLLIEGAKMRNVRSAEWLMSRVIAALRSGAEISQPVREFLAGALELAIASPNCAGAALGLVPPKARPGSNMGGRAVKIGLFLEARRKEGLPLKSSRSDGAFALAASKFNMSESGIERAWARYREMKKPIDEAIEAMEKQGYFK
ncbi:hypothetical protein [Dokdonella sp.]|uniref:hypothetical protein n=1 Tax=Dokdonella sp. TaxID=2291710 RepID=UPI003528926B